MQKLIMFWLVGAAVLTLSPLSTARTQPTDEDAMEAQAKIAQIQAILNEENEGISDDEPFESDQDPESQGNSEDDLEDQDDLEDTSDEMGSSGE
jgi:hypothetical protein